MKIVQINAVNKRSSTGTNTYELHRYLTKQGHKSYVFCTNENNRHDNIFRIGNRIDYKLHALQSRITGLQGYFSKTATKALVKNLESINPDIVVLGNLHGNYINLKILFSYLSQNNIAVVNILHDCWSFTGHCCHYTGIGCTKWMNQCYDCPLLGEDNVSYIDRSRKIFQDKQFMFHSINTLGVVGVSNWINNEAQNSPIFPSHTEFKTIYNWIDLDVFQIRDKKVVRTQLDLLPEAFYAISVSQQWNDAKGLTAIVKLALSMPEVIFILIGEKPKISGLPKNMMFPGVISDKTMLSSYYSAADVYLNFSKQETFGKVSAEALSCGLPILSSNTTASPEIAGECGISVDTTNPDIVLATFRKLLLNEYSFNKIACRHRAQILFNKEKNLELYLKFFERLMNKNHNQKNDNNSQKI